MQIHQENREDIWLVELLGRLDEMAAGEVEQAFLAVLDEETEKVLLDMTDVEYISSSGLRVLLMLLRALKQRRGALKICGLSPFVAEVFAISNFQTLFDVYANREDAWKAFGIDTA